MVLLDTHIWLWWLPGDGNLDNTKERKALDHLAGERQVSVSWISIWETECWSEKEE